ncbi:chromosome partitioning protein [Bacillus thermophilus]|uniref:Chromosome partitioning protein n=1 Tax=Siminovitchia thermophila TaxID=1245522 RepID=A0ABS2RDE2_9BACI|nr:ParA family protein [Siminovitchia thermophila]MBM7717189.1 chromosome partitioning protein [Siminovitchia thermophila]
MTRVIAVSTNKGGVLKTSITTNLAGVYSLEGKKVLIIDTDNQGNAALSFGLNPDNFDSTIYDVLVDGLPPNQAIVNAYENIDLMPCNDDMAFFEFDILTKINQYPQPFQLMRKHLEPILSNYDVVLIDTPPNLGLTQGNVLSFADHVLIPFQPESYSMRSLVKILKAIDDFKERFNQGLSVLGVVATLVDRRTYLHSQILQECRAYCINNGITLFDTIIPRTVRFASSVAMDGLPATLTDRNNPLIASYFELAKEMDADG